MYNSIYFTCRLLFFTDLGNKARIERASLDGTNRVVIVDKGIVSPTDIVVDPLSNRLYWSDVKLNHICSSDIDGGNVMVVIKDLPFPHKLAVFEDYIYFTDRYRHKLVKVNKFTGASTNIFDGVFTFQALAVYHHLAQTKGSLSCLLLYYWQPV